MAFVASKKTPTDANKMVILSAYTLTPKRETVVNSCMLYMENLNALIWAMRGCTV